MKRVKLTWVDNSTDTFIIGTTREIRSLSKNLRKRFYYLHMNTPKFAEKRGMYAICPADGWVISSRDILSWMNSAIKVEFT